MAARENQAVSVETLRAAARTAAEGTSLREAARRIGMSPSGLRTFLAGTDPYGPTLTKLRAWYAAQRGAEPFSLLESLPAEDRPQAEEELRQLIAEWRRRWGI